VNFRLQETCPFLSNLLGLMLRKSQNFVPIFGFFCSDMHSKRKAITSPMMSYTKTESLEYTSVLSPLFATLPGFCNGNDRSQETDNGI